MAAESRGMPSLILFVKKVSVETWLGEELDFWGTSKTSSKVRASFIVSKISNIGEISKIRFKPKGSFFEIG